MASEKVNFPDIIRKGNKLIHAKVAKIYATARNLGKVIKRKDISCI